MRAKWRKIIWAILAVQLLLVHLMILQSWYLSYFLDRASYHLGLFRLSTINWGKLGLSFINWNKLAIMAWLCSGCVVMLLYYLHYLRFRRMCIRQIQPVSEPWILESLQKAIEETGLQKRHHPHFLYYNSGIREPFVMGFGKPILLLPTQEYDREVLSLIFLHECYHIRHRDTLYKLFMIFMQSLLWFHPLIYLPKALSFRDIEVACDEAVIEGKDREARKAYGMALLTCLEKERTKGQAYSAYFYHGAYLMRARMKAIMNENKRWDYLAVASILILLTEVLYSGYRIGDSFYTSYLTRHGEEIVSIYEGYDIPESFNQSAVNSMLSLSPVSEDAYYREFQMKDAYEELSYTELPYQTEGPWQIRLTDADRYADALKPLLTRYLYYYIDQEWASKWDMEHNPSVGAEVKYWRLLAGSRENAVWVVVCKNYVGNEEELQTFPTELANRAQFVCEQGSYYAYFDWTVQVRMVKDYVFELEGVADTREILTAFQDQYPQADYGDVPALDLVYSIDREDISVSDRWKAHIDRDKDKVWVTDGDGVVREVSVPLSEVLERGDEMDGRLTSLQPGSYQVDENKMIFGYGGDNSTPFSVVFYDEESESFKKSVVTYDYFGGRKIFVDFPENSQEGFFMFTGERVVWQEMAVLFHTTDGGKSWQEVRPMGPDVITQTHSLTIGAGFITNELGFITIRSSDTPDIWRTEDGGVMWTQVTLPYVPEYYSMAYIPEEKDGVLTLYVGMEDYSEYGGTKAKYVSTDDGNTWQYRGIVLRK